MMKVTQLVGPNRPNRRHDVGIVQLLLNLSKAVTAAALPIDGKFSQQTADAIMAFQRDRMHLPFPDGCIDSDSPTMNALGVAASVPIQQATRFPMGPATPMVENDYQRAAAALECEVAAVKAVAQVESRGDGFLPSKKPKILFEAHVFSKQTHHKYDAIFPEISSRHWNRALYKGGEREYPRLMRAMLINRSAALKSASWGRFQIMGSNHKLAGKDSLDEFITAMFRSEGEQLSAFISFVRSTNLVEAMRKHDWATFAAGYNGPGYALKHYDLKIKANYEAASSKSLPVASK